MNAHSPIPKTPAQIRSDALAFRIYGYAAPREWNVSMREVADALDVSVHRVSGVCVAPNRRWDQRMRGSVRNADYNPARSYGFAQEFIPVSTDYIGRFDE